MAVKILVYTMKARCVNLVFRLKLAQVIMKMIDFFFQLPGPQQLMLTQVC